MATVVDFNTVLEWVGIATAAQRTNVRQNIGSVEDLSSLTAKDISDLVDDLRRRTTVALGKYNMPLVVQKRLKNTIEWIHDFQRTGTVPTIDGLDQDLFRSQLTVAGERAEIIKKQKESADTLSREAAPGALKGEKDWTRWSEAFENMLSTMFGVFNVPLSYVIRELESPIEGATFTTFVEQCVAKSPLTGSKFEADTRQVHQLIVAATQGEPSNEWIKPIHRQQNGRADMLALRSHYQGEGNTTRRIGEATRIRETLHYRNERALPFASYLSKMQHMFTLFKENEETYSDAMKLRFLFDSAKHPQLTSAVEALKVMINVNPGTIDFTKASNHLAAEVAKFPETQVTKRNVSYVGTGGQQGGNRQQGGATAPSTGVHADDGSIFTGYYPNFNSLSKDEKRSIHEERERKGTNKGKKGKYPSRAVKQVETTKQLKTRLKKLHLKISALKRKTDDSSEDSDSIKDNAGESFGGRKEKKKAKSY